MERRGQVTMFVIIAIVIVVAAIIVFSFAPKSKSSIVATDPVSIFVADCLEFESKKAMVEIAQRGGYYLTPKVTNDVDIPIYYDGLNNFVPDLDLVEKELGEYLSQKMFFCTKNFLDFRNEYEINTGKIKTSVTIDDEYIDFDLSYPVRLKKGESIMNLKNFNLRVDSKLGILYDAIVEFVSVSEGENCLSCMLEISVRENIYVDMFDGNEDETIFIFRDQDYNPENEGVLRYVFAGKSI